MDPSLIDRLDRGDIVGAAEWMKDEDDPLRVLAMFHGAIRHVYWTRKDINAVVALGRLALEHANEKGRRGAVGPIAYDVASFCWPGWDEPGITIDDETRSFGAEAAAIRLEISGNAPGYWIVGAHELARGNREAAGAAFTMAVSLADEEPLKRLYDGYAAIAHGEEPNTEGLDDELAQQLETAARLYMRSTIA